MSPHDLPRFPALDEKGPQVCKSVRFYLAIREDLPSEQVRILDAHVQECADCATALRLLQQATHLVAALPESTPSGRVDETILAVVQSQSTRHRAPVSSPLSKPFGKNISLFRSGPGVLAAALLLLVLVSVFWCWQIVSPRFSPNFQLPANLSWSGHVLHYTQTRVDAQGKSYQVEVYQDLGTNQMHVESIMPGQFDVVVVNDASTLLGKDMMHHVAQMGSAVQTWMVDGSLFHLTDLRQDLNTHQATYLGKGSFQSQEVYLVRVRSGQVLLLNMHYLPVGALRDLTSSGTEAPLYETCELMSSAQVSASMWNMQLPPSFRLGTLPSQS